MLDFDKSKEKSNELIREAGRKLKQYTPEKFSKEKKFVNALSDKQRDLGKDSPNKQSLDNKKHSESR